MIFDDVVITTPYDSILYILQKTEKSNFFDNYFAKSILKIFAYNFKCAISD